MLWWFRAGPSADVDVGKDVDIDIDTGIEIDVDVDIDVDAGRRDGYASKRKWGIFSMVMHCICERLVVWSCTFQKHRLGFFQGSDFQRL